MGGTLRGVAVAGLILALAGPAWSQGALLDAPMTEQITAVRAGAASASALTRGYVARIEALNHKGPRLNAVIALDPLAVTEAGRRAGPLRGAVILLKDNIESAHGATTAGSLALKDNVTGRDAPLVRRLTGAGAVILGKGNLSEWANFRSPRSISGWSPVGGLTRNPYALDHSACGSSSGPAVAVAAGLASAAIGTETDGSITCPASMNGLVGLKPTVGLISRSRIVPISTSQDTAGPITRTVADAAALLTVMAGSDPGDPATRPADAHRADYAAALKPDALYGARLGVLRSTAGRSPQTDRVYAAALDRLKAAGAVLVEVKGPDMAEIDAAETLVLRAEFKAGVDAYLATTPKAVKTRSLADLIVFDKAEPREMALFGQETFLAAEAAPDLTDPAYLAARERGRRLAGPEGIDRLLRDNNLTALVAITNGPASVYNSGVWFGSASTLPAVAGYPHLTVPMGQVEGLPVGLSFIGTAWSEARLLALGFAFERGSAARKPPPGLTAIAKPPEINNSLDP